MNTVDQLDRPPAEQGMSTKPAWLILLLFCLSFAVGGCADTYGPPPPAYAAAPYAAPRAYGPGYPGPVYGPGYPYGGGVAVEIDDRPYYTRGAGYYVGRTYYVWKPGHWVVRNGQRIWVHGHYVVR